MSKYWTDHKCPSTLDWIKCGIFIYRNKKELHISTSTTGINLTNIILNNNTKPDTIEDILNSYIYSQPSASAGSALADSANHGSNMGTRRADCKGLKYPLILVSIGVLEPTERQLYTQF